MKKKFIALTLVCSLAVVMFMSACNVSQFEAVLNEVGPAVATILQIIALVRGVPANTAPASKVSADVAAVEKLYNDYNAADATAQPGVRGEIQASFTVLNADLSTVFAAVQVSNPATQAKVTALIGLVETAVTIAEAAIPTPVATPVTAATAPVPVGLNAKTLKNQFNAILVAKTGLPNVDAFTAKHKL